MKTIWTVLIAVGIIAVVLILKKLGVFGDV